MGTYFAVGDTAKMDKSNCMCERPCVLSDRAQVKECETIEASTMVDISGTAKISSGGEVNFDRCTCKKLHIQGSDCVLEMEAEARLKAGGKGDEEESDSKGGDEEDDDGLRHALGKPRVWVRAAEADLRSARAQAQWPAAAAHGSALNLRDGAV